MTRTTNLTGSGAQTIIFEEPQYFSFLTLENLSIRFRHSTKYKLYFMRSIFIDVDGNDRGQTSCPVVWAEMQTDKM
ncbi:unnamed protein product [Pocillopora meandrina]|uniref:Uncharacterized protein n=1 Tax=Pocillopora meandrina TaxID=46732 RepID=A0AAU9WFI6_9CNID|nr:unnamed protein product [Pocillopora meandrina]